MLGNSLRREAKREDGEELIEAKMQSSIAGIAAGGTRRKLLNKELSMGSIENTESQEIGEKGRGFKRLLYTLVDY